MFFLYSGHPSRYLKSQTRRQNSGKRRIPQCGCLFCSLWKRSYGVWRCKRQNKPSFKISRKRKNVPLVGAYRNKTKRVLSRKSKKRIIEQIINPCDKLLLKTPLQEGVAFQNRIELRRCFGKVDIAQIDGVDLMVNVSVGIPIIPIRSRNGI